MEALRNKYIEASIAYVEQEKLNKEVIGIIVAGSTIYSKIDKNSDIDVHVILDEKCDYRERGNIWINGIEIEYFKNPPAQIRSYFEKEKKSPHTAHMLAYGEIRYKKSAIIEELIATAKIIMEQKLPKMKDFEIELEKYTIDDYYKDFEDALINENVIGAKIIRNKIINRSIDIFCKFHKIRRAKDKRVSNQIEKLDPSFKEIIYRAQIENWNKVSSLTHLRVATENLLGGRRTKDWNLRSQLDL